MIEGRTLHGIRFGIAMQRDWKDGRPSEDRIREAAAFLGDNPDATYAEYVEHVIREIVVNE